MIINKHLKLTFITLLLVFLSSCTSLESQHTEDPRGREIEGGNDKNSAFALVYKGIISSKCVSCHSGAEAPHGIDLTTYEKIIDAVVFPPLVKPYFPEESSLYLSVKNGSMPKKGPKLSDVEIKMFYDWIKAGAKQFDDFPENRKSPDPTPTTSPGQGGTVTFPVLAGEPCDGTEVPGEPFFLACK
jgi:uncharacterized membrane protein